MIRFVAMIDSIKVDEVLQLAIAEFLYRNETGRSSDIFSYIGNVSKQEMSLVTLKRALSRLAEAGILKVAGKGPATRYTLTPYGRLHVPVDARMYCAEEPDVRYGFSAYQFDLLSAVTFDPFTKEETTSFDELTERYVRAGDALSQTLHKKELERFVIELSWKSSRIEGNTYTLLDTERLLLNDEQAPGHTQEEADMIRNHRTAFLYIYEHTDIFRTLTRAAVEHVHTLLTKDLAIAPGLRKGLVGVTGSRYRPLDNRYQIEEAFTALERAVENIPTGYGKALVVLLGLSYIQPFEDGNKRTARLMANAVLLAHGLAPLSYRSIGEEEYREAMLVFYELNSLMPFKRIFADQYRFAAENYALSS